MALKFFELCYEHDFPPLAQVLAGGPRSPEVLQTAARARLVYLARLAAVVEREGSSLPRDAMRLFAGEVGELMGEIEILLNPPHPALTTKDGGNADSAGARICLPPGERESY